MMKYTLVLNAAPYSKSKTLALARKAGQRLADRYPTSAKIEIWNTKDVNAVLNLNKRMSLTPAACSELGVSPVDEWE